MALLRPRVALAAALLSLAGPAAAGAAGPPATHRCADQPDFRCGTLTVPLDRSGRLPGRIGLRFAVEARHPRRPLLVALAGGPGQSAVGLAGGFTTSLEPLLRHFRLAVVDQRGTGSSGVLRCPSVQRLRSLDPFRPAAVGACAQAVGPRRAAYTTADTVQDLDALRAALGSARLALMGVSYGTHVALQYARTFPARTDRLVLDSIVGPDGPDPFLLDTLRNLPRVLRAQCVRGVCEGVTTDPVADLAAVARRLARGPIAGVAVDSRGRRRTVRYASGEELLYLMIAGDLNPYLQAQLPAALAAARAGDDALLLRLRAVGQGGLTPLGDLSFGLNVTTGCTDGATPYPLSVAPGAPRAAAASAALAAIPPSQYAPFDAATVQAASYGDDCLLWPQDPEPAPAAGPLPDVPALLLGGRLDLRTPVENARATAAELPHASVVEVDGTGHDVLDTDVTGCATVALERFAAGRRVGRPCRGRSNAVGVTAVPPRRLREFRAAPGVGGRRGRVVFAVLDTLEDARATSLARLFAGVRVSAGGLRGGAFAASASGASLRLRSYAYLRGLRLSGRVRTDGDVPRGTVRVRGLTRGTLEIGRSGAVTGTLGGRAVRSRQVRLVTTARAGGAGRVPAAGLVAWSPDRAERHLGGQGLHR